ncbi:hotdog fold thioesterase [Fredinandcohnia humi]
MEPFLDENNLHSQYKNAIIEVMKEEPYAKFLGIKLIEIGPGSASAELEISDFMLNAHGTVHGAIIFAIADYVFEAASKSYGKSAVALSNTIHFMAAVTNGTTLKASANEEKKSNRIAWYKIQIKSNDELIATMEGVAYRKNDYFVTVNR